MNLHAFLSSLFDHGHVRVGHYQPFTDTDLHQADDVLRDVEQEIRREFPGQAPPLSLAAARWGAVMIYRGCQFLVFRDIDEAGIQQAFASSCPDVGTPSAHYSVDLSLRYLPHVIQRARRISEKDPLVTYLMRLADQWPLSAVGVPGSKPRDLAGIVDHRGLLQLYADRLIAAGDQTRLNDPRVCAAVRQALGAFPELAPDVAAAVKTEESVEIDREVNCVKDPA